MAVTKVIEIVPFLGFLDEGNRIINKNLDMLKTSFIEKARASISRAEFDEIRNYVKGIEAKYKSIVDLELVAMSIEYTDATPLLARYKEIFVDFEKLGLFIAPPRYELVEYVKRIDKGMKKYYQKLLNMVNEYKMRSDFVLKVQQIGLDMFRVFSMLVSYAIDKRSSAFPSYFYKLFLDVFHLWKKLRNEVPVATLDELVKYKKYVVNLVSYVGDLSKIVDFLYFYSNSNTPYNERVIPELGILDKDQKSRKELYEAFNFLAGVQVQTKYVSQNEIESFMKNCAKEIFRPIVLAKEILRSLTLSGNITDILPENIKVEDKGKTVIIKSDNFLPLSMTHQLIKLHRTTINDGKLRERKFDSKFEKKGNLFVLKLQIEPQYRTYISKLLQSF